MSILDIIGNSVERKTCSVCKQEKRLLEFPKNYNKLDNRQKVCFGCLKIHKQKGEKNKIIRISKNRMLLLRRCSKESY